MAHSTEPISQHHPKNGPFELIFQGLTLIFGGVCLLKSGKHNFPSSTQRSSP